MLTLVQILLLFGAFSFGLATGLCLSICGRRRKPPRSIANFELAQPLEENRPKARVSEVKCCETLIFPVEKLPCRCYYNYLIDQRPFNCRDRKGDKIHRQDGLQNSLMRMMEVMKRARRLDICMMNLALWELAHFLILMKERSNTAIRIVADGGKEFKRGTQLAKLLKIGVQVKIPTSMENNSTQANRGKTIMHHKFAIIDSDAAIMGSLNWTRSGVLHNREAVLITRNKNAISVLSKEFDLMWEQYENATQELFEEMSLGNP